MINWRNPNMAGNFRSVHLNWKPFTQITKSTILPPLLFVIIFNIVELVSFIQTPILSPSCGIFRYQILILYHSFIIYTRAAGEYNRIQSPRWYNPRLTNLIISHAGFSCWWCVREACLTEHWEGLPPFGGSLAVNLRYVGFPSIHLSNAVKYTRFWVP